MFSFLIMNRWFETQDTAPLTAELVLWHVAFNFEQYFLVVMILVEGQSVYNRLIAVAALQRSCEVQDSQRRDIWQKNSRNIKDELCALVFTRVLFLLLLQYLGT